MFYTFYADTLITIMLGWVRGFTDWIWNIINLGDGSAGRSFLGWFSENWLKLVVVLVIAGIVIDWLVWLVRWRPYWLWFGKKRRILDDTDQTPVENARRRSEAPHFKSEALPRTEPIAHPELTEDYEEDDLFDVVSPALATETNVPAAQQSLIGNDVNRYIRQPSAPKEEKPAPAAKAEINWFE